MEDIIVKGDTVGIGLEYIEIDKYNLFFTLNGELLKSKITINTSNKLKVILSLKMSTGIDINFGNKDFKFDLEKIINFNNVINSNNNNLITHFDTRRFSSNYILKESIYNWISVV